MSETLEPVRIMHDEMDETSIAIPFSFKISEYIIRDPDEWNWFRQHYAELEILVTDRLSLLQRENIIRFSRGKQCFFCDRYPLLRVKTDNNYKKIYIDYHADDCEWAKKLNLSNEV